jgi:AAA+ ATPase superfamily predicted ATPase
MPTFPTYNGELPSCLNPLNPRHWLLLAYWVYFRPTALRCYLYQADSELYRAGAGWTIFKTWKTPAYRNVFLSIPAICLLLSLPLSLFSILLFILLKQTIFSLTGYLIGLLIGITIGLSFGAIFGSILGLSLGVARGTTVGIITAIAGGVGHGIVISVVLSINQEFNLSYIFGNSLFGTLLGIATGVIVCLGVVAILGGVIGLVIGVVFGTVTGINGSLIFSILSSSFSGNTEAACLVFAVEFGLVAMGSLGAGVSFAESAVTVLVSGAAISLTIAITNANFIIGFFAFLIIVLLIWQFPIYCLDCCLVFLNSNPRIIYILQWNENRIFSLPKIQNASLYLLNEKGNSQYGLENLSYLACNPFQRWIAQKTLKEYLEQQNQPLQFIYTIIRDNEITDAYVRPPVTDIGWQQLPTIKKLLLGEISGQWVDCTVDTFNQQVEYLIYYMTRFGRNRRETPLTRFVKLLYQLLDQEIIDNNKFKQLNFQDNYRGLSHYSGGQEIESSFQIMESFLDCTQLLDIPAKTQTNAFLDLPPSETALRPEVIKALDSLRNVGTEINTYQNATSYANKQSAVLRANDILNSLNEYATNQIITPEKAIINGIIYEWRKLVSTEGGKLAGQGWLNPVRNPYMAGNPVTDSLFVGREDILRRLEELWMSPEQGESVILYGQRRIGKSSILRNLGIRLGHQTTVVQFNMQMAIGTSNTSELIYYLALEIYDTLSGEQKQNLSEPKSQQFTIENHYYALKRFLNQLDKVRDGLRFIIAVDEYENIEKLIENKGFEPELIWFWRGLIQTYPWFIMIFAGLHELHEMCHDYWNPLFASVKSIRVSFLSPQAARKLITEPVPEFDIDYNEDAVQLIISLTNGQPYLIQLICRELVTNFNREVFEEGRERERRFTVEDVETVINNPDFYSDGNAYFTGIWRQAEKSSPADEQLKILRKLCYKELSPLQLEQETTLNLEQVQATLKTLQDHDVIVERDGYYGYTVKLMQEWVKRKA